MWSWPRATADPACPRLKEGRTDGPSRAHGQFTEPVEKPSKRMEFQTAHRLYSTDVTSSNGTGRLCTLTYLWVQHHRTSQNITEHHRTHSPHSSRGSSQGRQIKAAALHALLPPPLPLHFLSSHHQSSTHYKYPPQAQLSLHLCPCTCTCRSSSTFVRH